MKHSRLFGALMLVAALGGCQTIGRWADCAGDHMPVIGDRCEHWQCFSASGRATSEEYQRQEQVYCNGGAHTPAAPTSPPAATPTPGGPVPTAH